MLLHAVEDWPEYKGQQVPCCGCGQPSALETLLSYSFTQQMNDQEQPTVRMAIFCLPCTALRHPALGRC